MNSAVKTGLIVRCDNRGLGNQTWEVYRHLPHEKTLVIRDPGSERQGFEPHLDRFPDGQVTEFGRYQDGQLDEVSCRRFLDGLDVVYSAETFYDWRFCSWAQDMGVATVLHTNPEFYFHWREPDTPQPSSWWTATPWRLDHLPQGARVVPMPVPIDRWTEPDFDHNPRQVMHVGGLGAIRDRNGTEIVTKVARKMKGDVKFLIHLQDSRQNDFPGLRSVNDYWKMYENTAPVFLLPRRYGGLCLPAIEALGAGKLVVMPAVAPNPQAWPVESYPAQRERTVLTTQGGDLEVWLSPPDVVELTLQRLFADVDALAERRQASYVWAVEHSWPNMVNFWLDELERAVQDQ